MIKRITIVPMLLLSLFARAQTNFYVDSSVNASGSGTSWAAAFKTLNEALNNISYTGANSYTVNIAKGTYYPTMLQNGTARDSVFFVPRSGVSLLGGFPSGGGARNAATNPTILSGNIGTSANSDNSYRVMIISAHNAPGTDTVVLDGLTFTGGNANNTSGSGRYYGANAVYYDFANGGGVIADGRTRISNCKFIANSTAGGGGAVQGMNGALVMSNCSFSNNTAYSAGAIAAGTFNTVIDNCTFSGNSATYGGGAVSFGTAFTDGVKLSNCIFNNNTAQLGGAVYIASSTTAYSVGQILNCTFTGNTGLPSYSAQGGAVWVNTKCHLYACSFTGNTAGAGGAVYANSTSFTQDTVNIATCSFTGNKTTATFGSGGGIFSAGRTTLDYCTFTGNKAYNGGGMCNTGIVYHPFTGNTFTSDTAVTGGAVSNTSGAYFANSSFIANVADTGGAIYNSIYMLAISYLNGCKFLGNKANYIAGAVNLKVWNADSVVNCIFSGNKAGLSGGAIYAMNSQSPIVNTTFAGDTALQGNAIYSTDGTAIVLRNSILWDGLTGIYNETNSSVSADHSIIQGGMPGTGNLSADPRFINPAPRNNAPTAAGNYALLPCSPAINAGNNGNINYSSLTDVKGDPRLSGGTVDMGAYEYIDTFINSILGSSAVCKGSTAQLQNNTSGGTWASSNTAIATVSSSGLVTGINAGTVVITYSVPVVPGCNMTGTRNITVDSISNAVNQSGATLSAVLSGASYQWINCSNNTQIAGATGQNYTATANGSYAVLVTKGSCTATSACKTVTGVGVTGVTANQDQFLIYPNPASDRLTVLASDLTPFNIQLADMAGKIVLMQDVNKGNVSLDIGTVSKGLYWITIKQQGLKRSYKVSIVR